MEPPASMIVILCSRSSRLVIEVASAGEATRITARRVADLPTVPHTAGPRQNVRSYFFFFAAAFLAGALAAAFFAAGFADLAMCIVLLSHARMLGPLTRPVPSRPDCGQIQLTPQTEISGDAYRRNR